MGNFSDTPTLKDIKSGYEKVALVVEDEVPLQNAIRIKLEKNNFSVVTARTAEQAMNHLKDINNIEVIWLDHYLLGKESGLDFLVQLKNGEAKWKEIPVFVVSNTASDNKVKSYLELDVEKYYAKSNYRLDEIITDIKKSLEK